MQRGGTRIASLSRGSIERGRGIAGREVGGVLLALVTAIVLGCARKAPPSGRPSPAPQASSRGEEDFSPAVSGENAPFERQPAAPAGTGGQAEVGAGGGSSREDAVRERWEGEITRELDRLNRCSSVADCEVLRVPFACRAYLVSKSEDRSALAAMTEAYRSKFDRGMGCAAVCDCSLVRCESGRCTARPGPCDEPATADQKPFCL